MSDQPPGTASRVDGAENAPTLTQTILAWLRSLGGGPTPPAEGATDPLAALVQSSNQPSSIDPEERLMLMNILKLDELKVGEVMVPRADIVALEAQATLDEAMTLIRKEMHSRIPVYRDTLDHIIGMVHVKDLIGQVHSRTFDLGKVMRKSLFVPPSMSVRDLLAKMRASRIHLAIVVDEYGGTDGLVTIEDLVEEIVGEIRDEHDEVEAPLLVTLANGAIEADARLPIADLERHFGLKLRDEEREETIDTVGGLVAALMGHVPRTGERVRHPSGVELEVIDADLRRVKRLRVRASGEVAASGT
ncbi:MAG: HlyC/CorC family transporter [Alphaproteobacteria bacterium]|nr:HlyC/CorC family transporter [Alphaproteobacteria bacterium]